MGKTTAIGWCDHTFNGVRGCVKVSEGCKFCYAERDSKRFPGLMGEWGPLGRRRVARPSYWSQLGQWNAAARDAGERRRVFAYSFADVFEQHSGPLWWAKARKDDPDERVRQDELLANGSAEFAVMDHARLKLFDAIRQTPHLDWLLLTKRPEAILPTLARCWVAIKAAPDQSLPRWIREWLLFKPPENVWLGTSVEDQATADFRIPHLLEVPAAIHWISAEPLLGPVDFDAYLDCGYESGGPGGWIPEPSLKWVVVGGESGAKDKARPFDVAWARSTIRQCRAAGVAVFCKQLGASPFDSALRISIDGPRSHAVALSLSHKAGADPAEWPSDLNVREFPATAPATP